MSTTPKRRHPPEARLSAVLRVRQNKESAAAVAKELGIDRATVYRWIAAYDRRGRGALLKPSTKVGRSKALREINEHHLIRALRGPPPSYLESGSETWTAELIVSFVKEKHHAKISIRTAYRLKAKAIKSKA